MFEERGSWLALLGLGMASCSHGDGVALAARAPQPALRRVALAMRGSEAVGDVLPAADANGDRAERRAGSEARIAGSETRLVQRFTADADASMWRLDAASFSIPPAGGGGALRLAGPGPRKIGVPVELSSSEVQRVALELILPEPEEVRIAVGQRGRLILLPAPVSVEAGSARVEFDLEWSSGANAGDTLWIAFGGHATGDELLAVELLAGASNALLERAAHQPTWLALGQDARQALALEAGAEWSAELEVGTTEYLEFEYALPAAYHSPQRWPVLRVRAEAGGRRIDDEFDLVDDGAVDSWRRAVLPFNALVPLGTERVSIQFELVSDDAAVRCLLTVPSVIEPADAPQSVLLITSSAHRADHLGSALAGVEVRTPVLDRLVRKGLMFEDFASSSSGTRPSLLALHSGLAPEATGLVRESASLPADALTLAEAFRAAGFDTFAMVSSADLGPAASGLGQGFRRYYGPGAVPVSAPDASAVDQFALLDGWLAQAGDRPVFVWWHLDDAHAPFATPPEFSERYWRSGVDPRDTTLARPKERLPSWAKGIRSTEYLDASYRAAVTYLDARLDPVVRHPRLAAGVIAFTADHGETLGEQSYWFDHRALIPAVLRVPLIIAWPGGPRGLRVASSASQVNLGRTLLDLAGARSIPFRGDNLSELAFVDSDGEEARFALARDGRSALLQYGSWWLVLHLEDRADVARPQRRRRHQVELFDLARDPGAEHDLSKREAERVASMRAQLVAHLVRARTEFSDWTAAGAELSAGWIDPDCACRECRIFE